MNSPDIMSHTLSVLDRSHASAATVGKPYITSHDKNDAPCADLRTAEIGVPIVRYWTVKFRRYERAESHYAHVIACDPWKAAMVVGNRDQSIVEAQVVREIDREEFEHLTGGT